MEIRGSKGGSEKAKEEARTVLKVAVTRWWQ